MKALLFTLDAVFSLMIAAVSISVLLFFTYLAQVPYPIHYSNSQAVLSELSSSTTDLVQNSSALADAIQWQFAGANQTSQQFLGGARRNSSGTIGPMKPIIAYTYNPGNAINTGVVADYGNIYFAANTIMYAVNATTNTTVWTNNAVTNVVTTPAIYSGMLYYATTSSLTAIDAKIGAPLWSVSTASQTTSPVIVYDNEVIVGAVDSNVRAYSAYNGTLMWTAPAVGVPGSIAIAKGNIEVRSSPTSNTITTIVQTANAANLLVATSYPTASNGPTGIATSGGTIYIGTGSSANAMSPNGMVNNGFPISTSNSMSGVAVYQNYVVYQNSNAVIAVSPSGTRYWGVPAPSSFGVALANSTPAVTATTVYTLWTNGLAGQNITTGAFQWFSLIPNVKISPYMTLAYGNLYVTANNVVIAYGPCRVPAHSSLLSASATLYLNKQPGCARALLNSVYPMVNYTVFAGNSTARTVMAASFGGSSNIIAKNAAQLNSTFVTVSFWMNMTNTIPLSNGVRLVNYGDNTTCTSVTTCGWFFYLMSNGMVQFDIGNNGIQSNVNGIVLTTNKWYHVVGEYNGSALSLIVNNGGPSNTPKTGVIGLTTPNINLAIGGSTQTPLAYFTGNIANLQIYRKPLSVQQISQLYLMGAGGVPIQGAGLTAWYPFGGDTNDYSMFNAGYATGIKFVSKNYVSSALSGAFDIARSSTLLPLLNYTNGMTNTILVGVYSWT